MDNNSNYYAKYLKYKEKYLNLKNKISSEGGKGTWGSPNRRTYQSSVPRTVQPSVPRTVQPSVPRTVQPSAPRPVQSSSPRPVQSSSPRPVQSSSPKPVQPSAPIPSQDVIRLYKEAFPKLMSNMGYGHCSSHMSASTITRFNNMRLSDVAGKLPKDLKSIAEFNSKEYPTFGHIKNAAVRQLSCPRKSSGSSSSSWSGPSSDTVINAVSFGML